MSRGGGRGPVARRWKRQRRWPSIRCQVIEDIWGPHEGCREFMSHPETHRCQLPATHVVKGVEPGYLGGPYKERVCGFHAEKLPVRYPEDGLRVYRFRRLAP